MCGICGFAKINKNYQYISEGYLKAMTDMMRHRGPDGDGVWLSLDNRVGLGHRRLSIVDLSDAASQPMANEDNSIVVCFNGEIYNHRDVRTEIENIGGHFWRTDHSDTEVIIHAYEEWGIDCIKKFRGMFAFALYDGRKNIVYLVRDRIGIKPLYYMFDNGLVSFASDINSLLKVKKRKPDINFRAVYDYLTFLCVPGENTIYEGIYKLAPAMITKIDLERGTIHKEKYWDVLTEFNPNIYTASEDEIISCVLSEFEKSTNLRKESDVPVGVFLSGGVDSSTNAVMFAKDANTNIETFSVGYDKTYEGCSSEFEYARKIARKINSNHHEIIMDEEKTIAFLDDLIRYQGEPIADPVCVPLYYLSKLARDNGVYVCQVGEGADELLAGYTKWEGFLNLEKYSRMTQNVNWMKKGILNYLDKSGNNTRWRYEILNRSVNNWPIYWSEAEGVSNAFKKKIFSDKALGELQGYNSFECIRPIYNYFKRNAHENTTLNWMSYVELNIRLPELLLNRVDKMSMAASVECRTPFLDHKFVELCMSIPSKMKRKNGISKYLLKKAARGIIPDEIIDRKKQGFGLPVNEWVCSRLGDEMDKEIEKFFKESGVFSYEYFQGNKKDDIYNGNKWLIYNLAACWKKNIY